MIFNIDGCVAVINTVSHDQKQETQQQQNYLAGKEGVAAVIRNFIIKLSFTWREQTLVSISLNINWRLDK